MAKKPALWFSTIGGVALVLALATMVIGAEKGEAGKDAAARGKYLVEFGGCHDCHSPKVMTDKGPVPDAARALAGHPGGGALPPFDAKIVESGAWFLFSPDLTACVGPWGASFAINLTPDEQTGIGLWSEEVFVKAMRTGTHMGAGGRPILPPMPWQSLNSLSDEDLKAIYAYLRTLKPVKNQIPAPMALKDLQTK